MEEQLNELKSVICRAANSVARQWPGVIDAEDVEQEIYVHLIERPASIQKILEMDDRARYRAIVGVGHQIARQERTDLDYYRGAFNYGVDDVKDLLKREVLTKPVVQFDAAVADLMDALERMVTKTPQYVDAVVSRYADMEVPAQGAPAQRLSDALESLTRHMNQAAKNRYNVRDDGPGTRDVMSNARARHISNVQYTGDQEDGDDYGDSYEIAYSTGVFR